MNMAMLLMIAASEGGGAIILTPGPELYPQPAFNASTGLTLVNCSVTGGQLVADGSGSPGTAYGTLAANSINVGDQFQYSMDTVTTSGGIAQLRIGGVAVGFRTSTGTLSGTYTASTVLDQTLGPRFLDNFAGDKVDNVSIKKLS